MLEAEAQRLINTAHRESTSKVYQTAQRSYLMFCNRYKITPLPLNEDSLLKYVSYLSLQKLSHSTIRVYYSGIKSYAIVMGFGLPNTSHRLNMAFRSLEINCVNATKKLPITLQILEQILPSIVNSNYNDVMLWASMTLAHFGLLRAAEFTVNNSYDPRVHLSMSDVSFHVDHGKYLKVLIKTSKTDKSSKGFHLHIGCSGVNVCAYCAMLQYFNMTSDIDSNPLRALFIFGNGVTLSRVLFIKQVKMFLALAGIDPDNYSGHSFRIGGATTAAAAGLADWEIQVLGRWTSNTYQRYIRTPSTLLVGFAQRMTRQDYTPIYNFRNPYVKNVFG